MTKRYYYDFHIHSCLSPCGDDDSTPNNIAGMASLCELDIVALTDHNTAKNCPAFFAAAEKYGIIPVAGIELTTAEDIHIVCLFEFLSDALKFDKYIEKQRMLIKNRPEIFGNQQILNEDDEIVGEEDFLLTNATHISIDDVCRTVNEFGGICYPAHIDRDSNGIIAILGTIPPDSEFYFFELRDRENIDSYGTKYSIPRNNFLISSDAHHLENMRDKENFIDLNVEKDDAKEVRTKLFRFLRGRL